MISVYLFFNVFNGKVYVGKSKDVVARCKRHFSHAFFAHQSKRLFPFQRALRKWGRNAWVVSMLGEFSSNIEACHAEMYWIAFFQAKDEKFGYNLTDGGEGTFGFHQKMSSETKLQMSKSHSGKKFSEQHKNNISKSLLGRKKSEEHVRNMRIANSGRVTSSATKLLLSKASSGSKNGNVTLRECDVLHIRALLDSVEVHEQRIKLLHECAKQFDVSVTCIRRIWTRQSWKHL